jgi:hypothetical protein
MRPIAIALDVIVAVALNMALMSLGLFGLYRAECYYFSGIVDMLQQDNGL